MTDHTPINFTVKQIFNASAGWTRAVAMIDEKSPERTCQIAVTRFLLAGMLQFLKAASRSP